MHNQAELPTLRATLRLGGKGSNDQTVWYDVKFYPYTLPGVDPVFAAVGGRHTAICRCVYEKENCIEILQWFTDADEKALLNSVEWSQAENGDPLVCVTGYIPRINIINVKTGELVQTLVGHGDAINDLAVSPINPRILASASADYGVRIWSLDPAHAKHPTAVIFFGEGGHRENVLSLGFHRSGKYLLSGGMDNKVCMWVVPDDADTLAGKDKPLRIHYPHFSSADIHAEFVDCIKFYDDIIISRAAKENSILIWKIDNFTSNRPPPTYDQAPIPPSQITNRLNAKTTAPLLPGLANETNSAWGGSFTRLIQLAQPNSELFYIRFSLFHAPSKRPILAAGNQRSRMYFWDLQRLEETGVPPDDPTNQVVSDQVFKIPEKPGSKKKEKENEKAEAEKNGKEEQSRPPTTLALRVVRESSAVSSTSSKTTHSANSLSTTGLTSNSKGKSAKNKEKDMSLGDPFHPLPSHKSIMVPKVNFTVRQVAWSRGGEWCVAVGEAGMVAVFSRWEGDGRPQEGEA